MLTHRLPNALTSANTAPDEAHAVAAHATSTPMPHAQRNIIERGFGQLKQWRGIASRYDKYALTFLGGVLLAATRSLPVPEQVTQETGPSRSP